MHGQTHDRHFIDDPLSGVSVPGYSLISGIRSDITSWADLAAVLTLGATKPVILEWYDATVGLTRTVVLQAGTDATDTAQGVQRPDDYDASLNPYVWYQSGNAG